MGQKNESRIYEESVMVTFVTFVIVTLMLQNVFLQISAAETLIWWDGGLQTELWKNLLMT